MIFGSVRWESTEGERKRKMGGVGIVSDDKAHPGSDRIELVNRAITDLITDGTGRESEEGASVRLCSSCNEKGMTKVEKGKFLFLEPGGRKYG